MSFLSIFQNYDENAFKMALMDAMQKFSNELSTTLNIDKEKINEIWLNSINETPKNEINTCKYVCSRGKNIGQPCLTKAEENGFCKKHNKQNEKKEESVEEETNEQENKKNDQENEKKNTCKFCFKKGKNIGKRCTKNVSKKSILGYCSTHIKEEKN
jgi:hypothetical protein